MVKLINESKDNSDAMLDALVKACKQVYGKEWDKKSEKEQRDIIMGFIKQAADNAKKSKKESMNPRRRSRRMNEDFDTVSKRLKAERARSLKLIGELIDRSKNIKNNLDEFAYAVGEEARMYRDDDNINRYIDRISELSDICISCLDILDKSDIENKLDVYY